MQPTAGGRGWYRGAQEFEDSAVAARIRHIVEPANEQNLDRLLSALAIPPGAARAGRCPDLGVQLQSVSYGPPVRSTAPSRRSPRSGPGRHRACGLKRSTLEHPMAFVVKPWQPRAAVSGRCRR